jgi:hypothetical protein
MNKKKKQKENEKIIKRKKRKRKEKTTTPTRRGPHAAPTHARHSAIASQTVDKATYIYPARSPLSAG